MGKKFIEVKKTEHPCGWDSGRLSPEKSLIKGVFIELWAGYRETTGRLWYHGARTQRQREL